MRWALLLSCCLSGCLIPLPIEEEPAEVNWPPFFDPGQVEPNYNKIIRDYDPRVHGAERPITLDSIDDPNPEDLIFWRWFVNYQGRPYKLIYEDGPKFGLSPELRSKGITFKLVPCELPVTVAQDGVEFHTIELIVADRPFVDPSEEAPDEQTPNQVLPADAGSFRVVWFLEFDRAICADLEQ